MDTITVGFISLGVLTLLLVSGLRIAFATARSGTKSGSYVFAKPKDEHPDPRHA